MVSIEYNKREMVKMIVYSIGLSLKDAAIWVRYNIAQALIYIVSCALITAGWAAFVYVLFGGLS